MRQDDLLAELDAFQIELPSWGFADTGTRFGKFHQPAAARTIEEKLEDAGEVHRLTGCCPSVAVHVLWDFPTGTDPSVVAQLAQGQGVRIGSINPNFFQEQIYKYGSVASPLAGANEAADGHVRESIELARAVGSSILSLWFADGTNYPGQDDLIRRKRAMGDALRRWHAEMPDDMTMLVEYKPFEPAFYHTDIADWGMAYVFAKQAGPRAKVLVDTGHHLQGANIEHIVAFLLDEGMLGGFHFNDRKYADDDLTIGSIDPYGVFRIFAQIVLAQRMHGCSTHNIAYMVDQSHNLKPKVEAMIQTVATAQTLYAKALLIDHEALGQAQSRTDVVGAEEMLRSAFYADVSATLQAWRSSNGLPEDPLSAYRASDYEQAKADERSRRHGRGGAQSTYA